MFIFSLFQFFGIKKFVKESFTSIVALNIVFLPAAKAVGMPQLDFSNPLVRDQVIWGVFIFLLLYLILSRSTLPMIERTLNYRRNTIRTELDIAEKTQYDAQKMRQDAKNILYEARIEARNSIDKIIESSRKESEKRSTDVSSCLKKKTQSALLHVSQAHENALTQLVPVVADVTRYMLNKLVRNEVDDKIVDKVVEMHTSQRNGIRK